MALLALFSAGPSSSNSFHWGTLPQITIVVPNIETLHSTILWTLLMDKFGTQGNSRVKILLPIWGHVSGSVGSLCGPQN